MSPPGVLNYADMRVPELILAIIFIGSTASATIANTVEHERRQRAAAAFRDGILLLHASSELNLNSDGFRQDPVFYYFTGLGNTVGAMLAIDGRSGESWLFLPSKPPFAEIGLKPEVEPGPETAKRLAMEHVVDWSELEGFFASHVGRAPPLFYGDDSSKFYELPSNLLSPKSPQAPTWLQIILQRWPAFEAKEVGEQIEALVAVQSVEETTALRSAAKATVTAMMAGLRAIRPGVSQRSVEAVVENACWMAGAHGSAFWPWAMAGDNAVFPRPFTSLARYDHLNQNMHSGESVRLDVEMRTGPLHRRFGADGSGLRPLRRRSARNLEHIHSGISCRCSRAARRGYGRSNLRCLACRAAASSDICKESACTARD